MLIECENCGFYVSPSEKFCPDCGLADPKVALPPIDVEIENRVLMKIIGIVGGAALVGLVLYRLNGGGVDFNDWFRLAFLFLFIGTVISIIAVLLNSRRAVSVLARERFINPKNGTSLQFIHDTCLLRNHELSEMRSEFRVPTKRGVRLGDGIVKADRQQAKDALSGLVARYELFLNRIFLARFQNQLLSLADDQKNLRDADFFDELGEISAEMKNMSAGVNRNFNGELSENFAHEKQSFLTAAKKTGDLCAVLADRRKETTRTPLTDEDLTSQSQILDARRTLAEISLSFDQLEREYERLKV